MLDTPWMITGRARLKRRAVALNTYSRVGLKSSHVSAPSSNNIEENRVASTKCTYLMRTSQWRRKVTAGILGAVLGVPATAMMAAAPGRGGVCSMEPVCGRLGAG